MTAQTPNERGRLFVTRLAAVKNQRKPGEQLSNLLLTGDRSAGLHELPASQRYESHAGERARGSKPAHVLALCPDSPHGNILARRTATHKSTEVISV